MVVNCTRQRVSALLSFSQAISGGFQCGAHPHDVRVLPVSLLISIRALLNIPENVACTRAASQPSEVSPLELSVADQIRLCHDRDGHPPYNTHLRMYKSREGRGYPVNFPSLLAHFKCETCAITRGARTYRTSKHVKEKGYHTKRKQDSEDILAPMTVYSPLECPDCDPSEGGLQDISRQAKCLALASQPKKKKRRNSKKAKGAVIAAPDEAAAPDMAVVAPPRLVHPPQHRMHISYDHSIILGRNKELYYLIIVSDSIDFTWAQPSPNRISRSGEPSLSPAAASSFPQ
jgi:hypothetical protein